MAVKSIVEIDVQADSFDAFRRKFEEYQSAVKALPGQWADVESAAAKSGSGFAAQVAALVRAAEAMHKTQLDSVMFGRGLATAGRGMHALVADTRAVAGNIGRATTSLLKWSGITAAVGGLLGLGGGLFGIDRLATSAYGLQRTSSGLGITPGEKQAADVDLARVVDPTAFFTNVQNALSNPADRWKFGAAGVNQSELTGDTSQSAVATLKHLKDLVDKTPQQLLGAVPGITSFLGIQDATRLKNMSPADFGKMLADYQKDAKAFQVATRAFADLSVQLARAGTMIETVFIRGLTPLAPELGKLSTAFGDAVKTFMESPQLKEWIGDLAVGVKEFAAYMTSPQFKTDITGFIKNVGDLATSIGAAVKYIQSWVPGDAAADEAGGAAAGAVVGGMLGGLPGAIAGGAAGAALGAARGGAAGRDAGHPYAKPPPGWHVEPNSGAWVPDAPAKSPGSAGAGSAPQSSRTPGSPQSSWTGSPPQKAFFSAISAGEAKNYTELVGGGSDVGLPTDATGFPIWSGVGNSHAAGLFQFEPATWHAEYAKLGLKGGMTPANQNLAAWDLGQTTYRQKTGRDLGSDITAGGREGQIAAALHGQWSSTGPRFARLLREAMAAGRGHPQTAQLQPPAHSKQHAELTGRGLQAPPVRQASLTIYNQTGGSAIIAGSQIAV